MGHLHRVLGRTPYFCLQRGLYAADRRTLLAAGDEDAAIGKEDPNVVVAAVLQGASGPELHGGRVPQLGLAGGAVLGAGPAASEEDAAVAQRRGGVRHPVAEKFGTGNELAASDVAE